MVKMIMATTTNLPVSADLEEIAKKKEEVLLLWRDLSMELVLLDIQSIRDRLDGLN